VCVCGLGASSHGLLLVQLSCGAGNLFLLGHKWGTITSRWAWWSWSQQMGCLHPAHGWEMG